MKKILQKTNTPIFLALSSLFLVLATSCMPQRKQDGPPPAKQPTAAPIPTETPEQELEPDPELGLGLELDRFGKPDFNENFEAAFTPFPDFRSGEWSMTGEMPAAWSMRTLVNEYNGTIGRATENVYAGKGALRYDIPHLYHTYADLGPDATFPSDKYLKIQFMARSPSTTRLSLGLRAEGVTSHKLSWDISRLYVPAEWMQIDVMVPPRTASGSNTPEQLVFRCTDTPSILEVDDLKVWVLEEEDLNRGIPELAGNRLPHSSFPFGLPTGWSLGRVGDPNLAVTDPQNPSPLQRPSLHIKAGARFLNTPSFQVKGGIPTRLSFYAKSSQPDQNMRIELLAPPLSNVQRIRLTPQWKRYTVTFDTPYPIEKFQTLKLNTRGEFWIDGLEVTQENNATAPRPAIELFLAHDHHYALQHEGSPLQLLAGFTGQFGESVRIQGAIEDGYGRLYPFGPHEVASPNGQEITLSPEEWISETLPPLGTYRIEMQVVDSEQNALSGWSELLIHRIRPPRHPNRFVPDSPFGIHALPTEGQAALAKHLGFNWVRLHDASNALKWYQVEKKQGQMDFTAAEREVALYLKYRLHILGVLDTSPPWASDISVKKPNGPYRDYWDSRWMPNNPTAWAAYCAASIKHFGGKIEHWEVWNEPYVGRFLTKTWDVKNKREIRGGPQDYHGLLQNAARAWSTTSQRSTLFMSTKANDFGETLGNLGVPPQVSAFTFHVYSPQLQGRVDDVIHSTVETLHQQLKTNADDSLVLWDTEGGQGPARHHGYKRMEPVADADSAPEVANALVRLYISHLTAGVEKFFLYSLHGASAWSSTWTILNNDDTLPQHGPALSNLFWHLEGKTFVRRVQKDDGEMLLFRAADENVAVWVPHPSLNTPRTFDPKLKPVDLFGNPYQPQRVHPNWPVFIPCGPEEWEQL